MKKLHCHIGAGSDPEQWLRSANTLLELVAEKLPNVEVLNLGGGFKVSRGEGDKETVIEDVAQRVLKLFEDFK